MKTNLKKLTLALVTTGLVACNSGTTASSNTASSLNSSELATNATAADTKGSIKVMATGQKTAYAPRDDGELQPGGEIAGVRFVSGTGAEADCIIDKTTGFMWPKNAKLFAKTSWDDSLNKINAMDSDSASTGYNLCGHKDWRMPNANELETLVNYAESSNATWLEAQGFENVERKDMYFTSTSYNLGQSCAHDTAFTTSLDSGITGGRNKSKVGAPTAEYYFQYAIPVRTADKDAPYQVPATGQNKVIHQISALCDGGINYTSPTGSDGDLQMGKKIPQNRFVSISGGECIKDSLTGLVWTSDGTSQSPILQNAYDAMGTGVKANGIIWDNMNQYGVPSANQKKLCGLSNWRLPTIREARSLYNYNANDNTAALNASGFNLDTLSRTGSSYLTSTPFAYKGPRSTNLSNVGISAWDLQLNTNLTGDEGDGGDQGVMKNRDLRNALLVSGGQTIKPAAQIKPAATDKVIFITQNGYSNFNGVSSADAICNAEAKKTGSLINKKAVFKALLIASNRYPCNSNGVCGMSGFSDWPVQPDTTYTTAGNNGKITSNVNGVFQSYPAMLIRDEFGYAQNRFFWTGINGVLVGESSTLVGWSYANQDVNWTKVVNGKSTSTISGAWSKYADLTANDWTFPSGVSSAGIGDNGYYPDSQFGDKHKSVKSGFGYATKNATLFDSINRWTVSSSQQTGWVSSSYWTGPQTHIMCVQQ